MLIEYNETIMYINTHWFTTQSYIIWFKHKIIKFQSPSLYFDDSEIPVVSHCLSLVIIVYEKTSDLDFKRQMKSSLLMLTYS